MKDQLLSIGVIGCGNCGGQMANAAVEEGNFDAIAINASRKDLELLSDHVKKFMVGDGRGSGKNRDAARSFIMERLNILQDQSVTSFIDTHDVLVVATSIGGGFGSGSSLVITKLLIDMYPEKAIIPAGVFPFESEAYTAQTHAVEWLQELDSMEATFLLYDNNRVADLPKLEACQKVNTQFVQDLRVFRGDFINTTLTGGVDNRDMLTALSVPGRMVVDVMENIDESDIIDDNIPKTIYEHIRHESTHADIVDDKELKASVVMYTLRSNFAPYTVNIKADMQEVFGEHINDYDNGADVPDDFDEPDSVAVILTGVTLPTMRINRMIAVRDKMEKSIIERKASTSKLNSANSANSGLKLTSKSFASQSDSKSQIDRKQIMAKFASQNTEAKTE